MKRSIPFSFDNGRGQKLAGLFDMPEGDPRFFGVFAPCFTCVKESHAAHKICRALAQRGAGMMRFDMTGLGGSQGDFAETNFSTRIQDIAAACRAVAEQYRAPRLLIGHSISGTAALAAAAQLPGIRILATLGSPQDPAYTVEKLKRNGQLAYKDGLIELTIAGRKILVKKEFERDMLSQGVAEATRAYDGRLFIFHAPHDDIASFDNARAIYARATCDKELIPLREDSTHLLENGDEDAAEIADALAGWASAHSIF